MPWLQPRTWGVQRQHRSDQVRHRLSQATFTVSVDLCSRCKSAPRLHGSWCKTCRSEIRRAAYRANVERERAKVYESSIKRRYGLEMGDYQAMLLRQGGLCRICGEPEPGRNRDGSPRRLHIDHNHQTGKIRDLLCSRCNKGLEGFRDDPQIMEEAIGYLGRAVRRLKGT